MTRLGIVVLTGFGIFAWPGEATSVNSGFRILKSGNAEIVRSFSPIAAKETFEVSWMPGQSKPKPQEAVAERFYPNAVFADGFWLRHGDYRLMRQDGTAWIKGKFKNGLCEGNWNELDSTGKSVRTLTCKKGFSASSNGTAPKSDAEFFFRLTDFYFRAGEFVLEVDSTGAVRLQLPPSRVEFTKDGVSNGPGPKLDILLKADPAFVSKIRSLVASAELSQFKDKYENKGIVDGTTRTFQWKDKSHTKLISCYVDCPAEVKALYRKVMDAFFEDRSFALELSAMGVFSTPGR